VAACAHNSSTLEAKVEGHKFKASLGYITRPCLKKKKKVVAKDNGTIAKE
jgi:hypothetical protein